MTNSYKDLIVWQKSMDLVSEIYTLTHYLPKDEMFGLISQMRRAAVSIPSNIAEGKMRGYEKECRQFFLIAFGSGGELETQVEIVRRLYGSAKINVEVEQALSLLNEIMRMLNKLISDLTPSA